MEQLDKDKLPQNWTAPLVKFVSNFIWQACDRVDMTDPANHPNSDGTGKSPAYGAYAAPVEQLLNTAFEGALKNWEVGPFAAWVGKTRVFIDIDLEWDFAVSLPNQRLRQPACQPERPARPAGGHSHPHQHLHQHQHPGGSASSSSSGCYQGWEGAGPDRLLGEPGGFSGFGSAAQLLPYPGQYGDEGEGEEVGEDIPVEDQWSIIVWLKGGERGTQVDMNRFVAVVDKMANPAFTKAADGQWDIFLSHFQGNAGNTVMSLKALLETASPGLRCWLDKDEDATEAGMRRGVAGSRYYLLFLTQGVLTRPFVQLEAREALALGKPVILVHETDPRFGAAAGFNEYVSEAPADLKQIFNLANSIPWYREEEFRAVSIKKILQAIGRTQI